MLLGGLSLGAISGICQDLELPERTVLELQVGGEILQSTATLPRANFEMGPMGSSFVEDSDLPSLQLPPLEALGPAPAPPPIRPTLWVREEEDADRYPEIRVPVTLEEQDANPGELPPAGGPVPGDTPGTGGGAIFEQGDGSVSPGDEASIRDLLARVYFLGTDPAHEAHVTQILEWFGRQYSPQEGVDLAQADPTRFAQLVGNAIHRYAMESEDFQGDFQGLAGAVDPDSFPADPSGYPLSGNLQNSVGVVLRDRNEGPYGARTSLQIRPGSRFTVLSPPEDGWVQVDLDGDGVADGYADALWLRM